MIALIAAAGLLVMVALAAWPAIATTIRRRRARAVRAAAVPISLPRQRTSEEK